MSQVLQVELPDHVFTAIRQVADKAHVTAEEVAVVALCQHFPRQYSDAEASSLPESSLPEQMADVIGSVSSPDGGRARRTGDAFRRLLAQKQNHK